MIRNSSFVFQSDLHIPRKKNKINKYSEFSGHFWMGIYIWNSIFLFIKWFFDSFAMAPEFNFFNVWSNRHLTKNNSRIDQLLMSLEVWSWVTPPPLFFIFVIRLNILRNQRRELDYNACCGVCCVFRVKTTAKIALLLRF